MPVLSAQIPESVRIALDHEVERMHTDESTVVTAALSKYLEVPVHTLFQISTSGALVAGVYDREVSVASILEHGDFGLGTFASLRCGRAVRRGHEVLSADPHGCRTTEERQGPGGVLRQISLIRKHLLRDPSGWTLRSSPHAGGEPAVAGDPFNRRDQGPE